MFGLDFARGQVYGAKHHKLGRAREKNPSFGLDNVASMTYALLSKA